VSSFEHINFAINEKYSKNFWVHPQYNEPNPTPLFFLKRQGLEIGNWDGMQLLHKIYGLITYLTCRIYFYKN
jgi:hypothetical protein